MTCGNCGAKLSCGCQKRSAANGKQCCSNCINSCNQAAGVSPQTKTKYPPPPGPYTPHP